jgi:hypothetical protein
MTDNYGQVHLTFEQYFSKTLTDVFGPFVALGGPEDYLPPEGAIRLYAKDNEWTERLDALARRAVCILVELGRSENLRWEFDYLRREGLQKKVFLVTQPSHEDSKFAWAYRGIFWRLKGIRAVSWQEFSTDLGKLGYDLKFEDPGPGSAIGFDDDGRGVLLTTQAQVPPQFVEPIRAWLVSGRIAGRCMLTECLSCNRRFHAATSADGKARDRFCHECDEGLSPAYRTLMRITPFLATAFGGLTFVVATAAPPGSWVQRSPLAAASVAALVASAIYVLVSKRHERKIALRVVAKYRKLAESGDAIAMFWLATMCRYGRKGLPKDDSRAVTWYRRAAEAGEAMAMVDLGVLYHTGDAGLSQDYGQALDWYRKGASAGDESAMYNIGYMYQHGQGELAVDESEAKNWYEKAANLGSALAKEKLERLQKT